VGSSHLVSVNQHDVAILDLDDRDVGTFSDRGAIAPGVGHAASLDHPSGSH
jgi:hypothetical protein